MTSKLVYGFLFLTLLMPLNHQAQGSETFVANVYNDPILRQKFAGFLDEVLRQMPANDFFALVDSINETCFPINDGIWYQKIAVWQDVHRSFIKTGYANFLALKHQKKVLTKQAATMLKNMHVGVVDGCLEIGTPATYINALRGTVPCNGHIYALMDKKQKTDFLQSFRLRSKGLVGYDTFVELNDYEPIDELLVPSNSVDLVICYQGLHHIPQEKLLPFITSLHRILRAGGVLLVREHNATSDTMPLVHAAHHVFNILSARLPLSEECAEYRNFQPLSYWKKLVTGVGFDVGSDALVQHNDPTENTLVGYVKKVQTLEDKTAMLSKQIATQNKNYERRLAGSYLSAPEWFNVDVSQEYGDFINHTPFYEFPYFKSIKTFWHIYKQSFDAAVKQKGYLEVLKHDSMVMDTFIGAMMTLEYAAKGLISIPVRWSVAGSAPATMQAIFYDPYNEIELLGEMVQVLHTEKDTNLVVAEIPRYMDFVAMVKKLKNMNTTLVEVGGQQIIHVKMRCAKTISAEYALSHVVGYEHNYTWESPSLKDVVYSAGTLQLSQFKNFLNALEDAGIEFVYAHDY